mmetsp:Transcript_120896/g.303968  ORF Transcript_120896/g.303968 Transcript_120896/m.303968 type:complete len:210 (-) Transcript_120896:457-1086(-)
MLMSCCSSCRSQNLEDMLGHGMSAATALFSRATASETIWLEQVKAPNWSSVSTCSCGDDVIFCAIDACCSIAPSIFVPKIACKGGTALHVGRDKVSKEWHAASHTLLSEPMSLGTERDLRLAPSSSSACSCGAMSMKVFFTARPCLVRSDGESKADNSTLHISARILTGESSRFEPMRSSTMTSGKSMCSFFIEFGLSEAALPAELACS